MEAFRFLADEYGVPGVVGGFAPLQILRVLQEIMISLVGSVRELQIARERAEAVFAEVSAESGFELDFPIGCMIELPRAVMSADTIAEEADFFSFGTNDLTQTTWGFSRDDVEGVFFKEYLDEGVFGVSPFETVDKRGVGRMVEIDVELTRSKSVV